MSAIRRLFQSLRGQAGRQAATPLLEQLETRTVPALLASQVPLVLPTLTGGPGGQVDQLLQRAAAATASDNAIVAIVDRMGNILGVRVEAGVSTAITSDPEKLHFAIDGALAEARTGAFFGNDAAPLTSRTIQFISQSTITEREVNSDPSITDPNSTLRGPGLVAPIGLGGHFPPGVAFTPQVDLFNIELTNRDSIVSPGPDGIKGTADDVLLPDRFNLDPAFVPAGKTLNAPLSYGEAILTPGQLASSEVSKSQSRGIGTLPGGLPIYEDGELVGGIGVFFPGTTGYASEENSSLSADFNPAKPDLSLEAEFIGLAAVGGSSALGLPVGTLGGVPPLPGFDFPGGGRIDLVGITLPIVGPGGDQGPANLVAYALANLGVGQGNPNSGVDEPVDSAGTLFKTGVTVPDGWLVVPHDGVNITAAEVQQIIAQGINEANLTRAQIRLPLGDTARMVFAVADSTGAILGLYRMPDATVFSIDVAVAKARNVAYYDDPAQLQPVDQVPGLPPGVSMTNRTFRYLAEPRFPEGIDGAPPGFFSILNSPGINQQNGLNSGPPLPASVYDGTVLGYDAFHPGTNFHAPTSPLNQNGIVFFPGSSAVYKSINGSQMIVGGFGVSGDGVDQDDVVTAGGIAGFGAPSNLTADQFTVNGVRLPYIKFPRNPHDI
jgi:uncharacterized protein GlcG (DUF336 family)